LEYVADRQNLTTSYLAGSAWHGLDFALSVISRWQGDRLGIDGSWSGNDTVWRMCLDLNRILLYGRADAGLADRIQRRVIHIVDAVIAGQGDGPLAPDALPMGFVLVAQSAAATDWVGARLLSYDPARVPLVRGAFQNFRWPLVNFSASQIRLAGDLGEGPSDGLLRRNLFDVDHPLGWRDAAADQGGAPASSKSSTRTEQVSTQPWDA
jgi:hypothetical protein